MDIYAMHQIFIPQFHILSTSWEQYEYTTSVQQSNPSKLISGHEGPTLCLYCPTMQMSCFSIPSFGGSPQYLPTLVPSKYPPPLGIQPPTLVRPRRDEIIAVKHFMLASHYYRGAGACKYEN